MRYTWRPISTWPPGDHGNGSERDRFRSTWTSTLDILAREVRLLGADRCILEVDVTEAEITLDGSRPRVDARPASSRVAVSFTSRHGDLRYVCHQYRNWKSNIRAIALALEALRAVDRYGVSGRGEQYRGWRQIEGPASNLIAMGREIIRAHGGVTAALKATHPDHGGSEDDFRAVQAARANADI